MSRGIYDRHLDRNAANFAPLTPLDFLARTAQVFPERPAVIHGERVYRWRETADRCRRLAAGLAARGIGEGDTVAVMAANIPAMFEAHFGVPMAGAVLNAINTRLDAAAIAFILDHGEAKAVLVDPAYADVMREALAQAQVEPLVVGIDDPQFDVPPLGSIGYEALLADADPEAPLPPVPRDEWQAISLNYTSGTTGNPKGVVFHHRGAALAAMGNALAWGLPRHAVYLWTLPMFHCNGWCFPWTLALQAAVSVCLRQVRAEACFDLIRRHRVTHLCGAPVVMSTLANAPDELKAGIEHTVHAMTAGAAPPAAVIEAMESMGFEVTHVYGLTETYGPAVLCEEQPEWAGLAVAERARLKARQGVRYPVLAGLEVMDPDTMTPVPADGEHMGEVMFRGNIVMKGYLKNPAATDEAFAGGWFHSGDLAVRHPDGYIQVRDRSKDIIISGGENISSLEVEDVLFQHPDIVDAAVVAAPHERWGETPCAFVTLREGATLTAEDVIAWCRDRLAHFKCPTRVVFGPIAKTSTGKVQKFLLRERAAREAAG